MPLPLQDHTQPMLCFHIPEEIYKNVAECDICLLPSSDTVSEAESSFVFLLEVELQPDPCQMPLVFYASVPLLTFYRVDFVYCDSKLLQLLSYSVDLGTLENQNQVNLTLLQHGYPASVALTNALYLSDCTMVQVIALSKLLQLSSSDTPWVRVSLAKLFSFVDLLTSPYVEVLLLLAFVLLSNPLYFVDEVDLTQGCKANLSTLGNQKQLPAYPVDLTLLHHPIYFVDEVDLGASLYYVHYYRGH